MTTKKKFRVNVTHRMEGFVTVEAESEEQAAEILEDRDVNLADLEDVYNLDVFDWETSVNYITDAKGNP